MILILAASSLASLIRRPGESGGPPGSLTLEELPRYAREQLGFGGLAMSTSLLAGADRAAIERFRDVADRARCSCIFLEQTEPLSLVGRDGEQAVQRLGAVIQAASLLGSSAAAFRLVAPPDDEHALEHAVDRTRRAMDAAEKLGINLLFRPHEGLTADPERLTDLIKRVGGFRLGTLPDFQFAAASSDPSQHLRRITPYAAALLGSTAGFAPAPANPDGSPIELGEPEVEVAITQSVEETEPAHGAFDIDTLVSAVHAVGFDQAIAVDYRGEGDPRVGTIQSRIVLERAIERAKNADGGGSKPATTGAKADG